MKKLLQRFYNNGFYPIAIIALFLFSGAAPQSVLGQLSFAPLEFDHFNLGLALHAGALMIPNLVDIDGDEDLDLFVAEVWQFSFPCFAQKGLNFYQNIGSADCPEFAAPVAYPFGIPNEVTLLSFVDIDGDGDQDLFSSTFCATGSNQFLLCENTGSRTEPVFGPIQYNPFNLDPSGVWVANLVFGDIDNDGDFDAFINGRTGGPTGDYFLFQRNTGTAQAPSFEPRQINPFGLSNAFAPQGPSWAALADWDCDGDLDISNCLWNADVSPSTFTAYYHENRLMETGSVDFKPGVLLDGPLFIHTQGDMDGDGDLDAMGHVSYGRNIGTDCVTLPEASFTYAQNTEVLNFTNTSKAQGTVCNPVSWLWDFGDDSTSTEEHPMHTFASSGVYDVCLTVEDIAGRDTFCSPVMVTSSTAGIQLPQHTFHLSPNPVSDALVISLNLDLTLPEARINILDALGRPVRQTAASFFGSGDRAQVSLSALPAGVYTVFLRQERQYFSQRIVKVDP